LKDLLYAYLQAAQLLQDGQQAGPLDDQKLKELGNALQKLGNSSVKDALLKTFDDVKNWNELAKMLQNLPQDLSGLGQDELTTALEIIAIVEQALAAVGYSFGYGAVPDYGYGYGVGASGYYPEPPVPAAPVVTAPIILSNPAENGVTMPFLLNNETTQLPAGQYLELPAGQAWEIKFDRGQGFGIACYSLIDGPYKFTHTKQGWELVQAQ
jgi:hypothetical protein